MRKRHGVSVPSASDRFDFFEVGHSIGMSAEVNVLPLHVLHLTDKVQIIHIRPMLLGGHADLAAALVHFVDDGGTAFSACPYGRKAQRSPRRYSADPSQYRCRSPQRRPQCGMADQNSCRSRCSLPYRFYYTVPKLQGNIKGAKFIVQAVPPAVWLRSGQERRVT